jgi:preprotein translocase subunit SecG
MVMMPVTTAGMNALPDSLMSHGTAVNNTIRTVAGSIGTAVLISILTNVTKHNAPSSSLKHSDPAQFMHKSIDAALNGMNTAFMVAILFCLLTLVLTFFIKGKEKHPVTAQGAD